MPNTLEELYRSIEAAGKVAEKLNVPVVTAQQQPRTGHMAPFRKERDDWRLVYQTLRACQHAKVMGLPANLDKVIALAAHYAGREYPSYQMHAYPTSFQATDLYIVHREDGRVLLGRKHGKKVWRLCGGFVDPKDNSLEEGAEREMSEETGLDGLLTVTTKPRYLFSQRVPDPRYENSPDKIMTAVMEVYHIDGTPKAGDDIAEVKWFTKDYIRRNYKKFITPEHHGIIKGLIDANRL